ncbi:MAG: xanthine dehydrogenase family protein subunit M [Deltaproteobacteria bacterium]|nr:xanthine dehydrogenase family protein subunit M [Deltaproteobacteria bacterium]
MTIRSFELLRPKSIAEASELLVKHGDDARLIAGGTTLVILMKQRVVHYPYLVDLQGIPGLDGISQDGESVRIGAMATHRSVERSPIIRNSVPIVAEAFGHIGNVRVRQSASVGGNLAHADPRLDPPPTLLILGAELAVLGPKGSRVIAIKDFYRGMYETALEAGEILFEVKIPAMPREAKAVYLRYSSLSANDWPCLGVAGLLSRIDSRCEELRLALGGVAETPLLVRGLDFVRNEKITGGLLDEVVKVVDRQIAPLPDFRGSEWYKRQMVSLFVKRAIRELEQRFSQ